MTKSNVFTAAFLISVLTSLIGLFLKILHLPGAQVFLVLGIIMTFVYAIIALVEIYGTDRITTNEKIMWTVSFVLFSTLAGVLYYFIGRPRMTREYKILHPQSQN